MIRYGAAAIAVMTACLTAGSVDAGPTGENLMSPLPKDFKIADQGNTQFGTITEYVPQAEGSDNWSSKVTVQVMHIKATPDQYATGMLSANPSCPGVQSRKLTDGNEDGYAFSLWIVDCPFNLSTGKSQSFVMKLIAGHDALYCIQYSYRQRMSQVLKVPALQYLMQVKVCDTRTAGHGCPSDKQAITSG